MARLSARIAAHVAFGTRLREASMHRELRWDPVPGLWGQVPGWVVYEAEQMLALVNELRAENGLSAATLEQVLRIEQSACGHSDYPDKYALRCAFLALGEED
ncbi:hypothetical protein [Streptomyces sp.]|uniref:hypothetical protein n=1 Tax=Streptomyces sp. TaxID=1931 RepID=UPI002F95DC8D